MEVQNAAYACLHCLGKQGHAAATAAISFAAATAAAANTATAAADTVAAVANTGFAAANTDAGNEASSDADDEAAADATPYNNAAATACAVDAGATAADAGVAAAATAANDVAATAVVTAINAAIVFPAAFESFAQLEAASIHAANTPASAATTAHTTSADTNSVMLQDLRSRQVSISAQLEDMLDKLEASTSEPTEVQGIRVALRGLLLQLQGVVETLQSQDGATLFNGKKKGSARNAVDYF